MTRHTMPTGPAAEKLSAIASSFAMSVGTSPTAWNLARDASVPFDESRAMAAAGWYSSTLEDPTPGPAERVAWARLADAVAWQAEALAAAGFTYTIVPNSRYADAAELAADVEATGHVYVMATDPGSHPLWTDAQNDKFRWVHDLLGHVAHGATFTRVGEDRAYRIHAATMPPDVRAALACETRAQNAMLNYGPRPGTFAPQVCSLAPAWLTAP